MKSILTCNGELVNIQGHNLHIYRIGHQDKPTLVLMSGSGTIAPVYDFKILYEKLAKDFRVVVMEKFGYGYSDICDFASDVDTLVSIQKQALEKLGEPGPYILMPHSMSGIEALRWIQLYPDDVKALIGNDMTTPLTYGMWTMEMVEKKIKLMNFATKYKLHWLLCPINNRRLTKTEIEQHKMLRKRNAFNLCHINESKAILESVSVVEKEGYKKCPALLFKSNNKQTAGYWSECQKEFASILDAKLISYDCGHYIHHYKSEEMYKEISKFVGGLEF